MSSKEQEVKKLIDDTEIQLKHWTDVKIRAIVNIHKIEQVLDDLKELLTTTEKELADED